MKQKWICDECEVENEIEMSKHIDVMGAIYIIQEDHKMISPKCLNDVWNFKATKGNQAMDEIEIILEKWNKRISRAADISMDVVIREGKPPDEALKNALVTLLHSVADFVERTDTKYRQDTNWFPMKFPMRMTLESQQCPWDFQLILTLMNKHGIADGI